MSLAEVGRSRNAARHLRKRRGQAGAVEGGGPKRHVRRGGRQYAFEVRAVNTGSVNGPAARAVATPVRAPLTPGSGYLVSNFGQRVDGSAQIFVTQDIVGVFTTGAQGADLHSIDFRLFTRRPNITVLPIPSVTLYRASVADNRATRGERVAALTAVPGSPLPADTAQTVTFTVPAGTRLEAGAEYLVVLEQTSYLRVESTTYPAEDAGGAPGWAIDGIGAGNNSPYSYRPTASLLMRVNGTPSGATVATAPDAPASLDAAADDGRVSLTWTPPRSDGGAGIEKYQYRYSAGSRVDPETGWTDVPDGSDNGTSRADERSITLTGLENATQYAFELRADNGVRAGAAVTATATPAAPRQSGFLVSNFGQPVAGSALISRTQDIVGVFTTRTQGGTLNNVEFRLFSRSPDVAQLPSATLYRGSVTGTGVTRGAQVATLAVAPGSPRPTDTAQTIAFTAAGGAPLDAGATYLVVLDEYSDVRVESTNSPAQDAGGASGWTIDGIGSGNSSPYSYRASGSLLMSVNGTTADAQPGVRTGPRSEGNAPTARFAGLPQSHDGATAFTVELHFSENIAGLSYTTVGNGLLNVTGATVTGARRLNPPSNQSWEVTVTPTQNGDITINLPARACTEPNAVCVNGKPLAEAASATVSGSTTFTGTFGASPAEHDGDTPFTVHFHLSVEPADLSYKTVHQSLFTVTGGQVTGARRLNPPSSQSWEVTVDPTGASTITMTVQATTACNVAPGVCTAGGRMLPGGETLTVDGPGSLSVADATAEEGTDDALEFVVTLSRPRFAVTTVQYATSDGQAVKGADYTETTGTLQFGVLETQKIIRVPVLDDDIDDTGETMTLTLSSPNPSGYVRIADGEATGTITNSDPLPRALMARFGRTAAVHVVEHVEERLAAPREPGFRGQFAGRELRRGMERDFALNFLSQFGGSAGVNAAGMGGQEPISGAPLGGGGAPPGAPGLAGGVGMATATGPMDAAVGSGEGPINRRSLLQMGLGGGNVLTGSAFSLNRETRRGGIVSFWSRGARSHFSGRDGALSLGGDVRTTMFGADYAKGPLVTGLSLSHSRGLGEYDGVVGGQVASAVTGLYPWLGYKATDRISVWGVAGYGAGGLLLTTEGGPALESGLSMAMTAARRPPRERIKTQDERKRPIDTEAPASRPPLPVGGRIERRRLPEATAEQQQPESCRSTTTIVGNVRECSHVEK